jgi:hypothetical protein
VWYLEQDTRKNWWLSKNSFDASANEEVLREFYSGNSMVALWKTSKSDGIGWCHLVASFNHFAIL